MLKRAIYCNVFIILIVSIIFIIKIIKKKNDLYNIRKLVNVYMILNFLSFSLSNSGIVDIGWDGIVLIPISIITFIIQIISIWFINKKKNYVDSNILNLKKCIIWSLFPVAVFVIPYIYELYIINNCTYLLKYNYQNGIVQSDNMYIAIINKKPVSVTLQKNLVHRNGVFTSELNYDIIYNNDIEISIRDSEYNKIIIENDNIKEIALDARERCPHAKGAYVDYFSEENMAIIVLLTEENWGTELGEYFYYDNTYVKSVDTLGDLVSIIYYK